MINSYRQLTADLVVIENDTPLADSRQIAKELDIEHSDFFSNIIKKYQDEVEEEFGLIRFENGVKLGPQRGLMPKHALLTEGQSYVYMAYSKNTEKARACKRMLIKAFLDAKEALSLRANNPHAQELASMFTSLQRQITEAIQLSPAEQAIKDCLMHTGLKLTTGEIKINCLSLEVKRLPINVLDKLCDDMARKTTIRRQKPIGNQTAPRFFF